MSASYVASPLAQSPKILHGFWHSLGTTLPKGAMLTVNQFQFTVLSSGITLLASWVLSRLWRILSFLLFRNIFERSKSSLKESQCAALIVNSNAAFDALLTSFGLIQRGREATRTLVKIAVALTLILLMY